MNSQLTRVFATLFNFSELFVEAGVVWRRLVRTKNAAIYVIYNTCESMFLLFFPERIGSQPPTLGLLLSKLPMEKPVLRSNQGGSTKTQVGRWKKPWLFRAYRGWKTTQLCRDRNNPWNNPDPTESKAGSCSCFTLKGVNGGQSFFGDIPFSTEPRVWEEELIRKYPNYSKV